MLFDKFQNYVRQNQLCTPGDKVLLTVSGGVDSMVMLSLFAQGGYNIGVAHCNFQLRGEESEEDEVLVDREAARYGVPCYNKRFDTGAEMAASGDSLQMAARRLRYEWFEELCTEHGYTHIAIAHQADDSVETFIINLLRGTGLRGLTGINVINGRLIRPLLFAPRREILDYAQANKIPFREDSSNRSTKYLRNKIRLGVIPRIREISPQFTHTMSANVERLTAAQSFIDQGMALIRRDALATEGDRAVIDLSKIDPSLPMKFVIFELMYGFGFRSEPIDNLYRALTGGEGSGRRFYTKDNVAYLDRDRIIVTPIPEDDTCVTEVTPATRKVYSGSGTLIFDHLGVDDIDQLNQPENVALLDEELLRYPLIVRRWEEGDQFVPIGMSGHKKVSDLLIDAKVSLPDKRRQFVVTSEGNIVWVVGRRIDDRYKVGDKTEKVLRITRDMM